MLSRIPTWDGFSANNPARQLVVYLYENNSCAALHLSVTTQNDLSFINDLEVSKCSIYTVGCLKHHSIETVDINISKNVLACVRWLFLQLCVQVVNKTNIETKIS